ncbi:MAG: terminase large subunit domain-containing protein [Candidatus Bathyarchaeia archaeon]|jgi:phage FluMu gp28-like protein
MKPSQKQKLKSLTQKFNNAQTVQFPVDPTEFFREILGFTPTIYQAELVSQFQSSQFIAARWARQTGKSHTISALLLHYALVNPNCNIGIVGPSWRQTKLIIKTINGFLGKLPKGSYKKPQRTNVSLTNGSIIEAYPNNPETIRGPKLHIVYADEFNFIPDDEELYDAMLFTLGTTNGKFICTSTPWSTDSIFHKIFHDQAYADYAKSHVTYQQALEPNGPLKQQILNRIRKQLEGDPCRWQREMEANWAENQNTWLSQALITQCIDHTLDYTDFETETSGVFYGGLDLGKHQDASVLAIFKLEDQKLRLVHLRRFPLETPYASVIGYVKTISDRWQTIGKILVDQSGVGDYITEDMTNTGLDCIEGVTFTAERKQEMAQHLKQAMTENRLFIPYDSELIAELNLEQYELSKDGKIRLSHPVGTHDDRFWALALAAYASRTQPAPKLWVISKAFKTKNSLNILRQKLALHKTGEGT